MAKLPGVEAQRPVPRPARAIAQISPGAAGAVGAAMQDFGNTANLVGLQIADREATAQAKEADALVSDKIRALLYDPETGFANMSGGSAVAARERVMQQLDALAGSMSEGMSNAARRKFEDSMTRRIDSAKMTVDTHTSGERKTWINGASAARAESAYQDSLVNPGATAESLRIIEGEIRGTGAREGWSAEETTLKVAEARSKVYAGNAERIALVDPQAAAAFLAENKGNMLGADIVALEAKLIPLAKEARGRQLADDQLRGAGDLKSAMQIAASTLGMNEQEQADTLSQYLKDGGVNLDPATTAWCAAHVNATLAQAGIKGTGSNLAKSFLNWGEETGTPNKGDIVVLSRGDPSGMYGHVGFFDGFNDDGSVRILGGNQGKTGSVSIQSYGADKVLGFRKMPEQTGKTGLSALVEIQDPKERDAALAEWSLRTSVIDGERKAEVAAASNQAFTYLESGGSLADLTLDEKTAIGQAGMTSLRSYENALKAGSPVETDLTTYAQLRGMEISDPEGFKVAANSGFVEYADKLSLSDRKSLVDKASSPEAKGSALAASSLMSVATSHLRGIGIKANDPKEAVVQSQLLMWQDGFKAATGKYPSQLEVDQQVGRMLMEVVINPSGIWDMADEGMAFEAASLGTVDDMVNADELIIGGKVMKPGQVGEVVSELESRGISVTPSSLMEYLTLFVGANR